MVLVLFEGLVDDVLFPAAEFMTKEEYIKGEWQFNWIYITNVKIISFENENELIHGLLKYQLTASEQKSILRKYYKNCK